MGRGNVAQSMQNTSHSLNLNLLLPTLGLASFQDLLYLIDIFPNHLGNFTISSSPNRPSKRKIDSSGENSLNLPSPLNIHFLNKISRKMQGIPYDPCSPHWSPGCCLGNPAPEDAVTAISPPPR
jgi:hypothetical protein